MAAYNGMQGQISSGINSYINAANTLKPLWMQQSNQNINQIGARQNSNLMSNATANGGAGNLSSYMQASLARNSRSVGSMQSNSFLQSQMAASQMQMQGIQMAEGYKPLQTGGTQTQQTSGLGTWLPQAVGAGLSIAAAIPTGGASLAFPNMTPGQISGAFGGPTSAPTTPSTLPNYIQPNAFNPTGYAQTSAFGGQS